MFNDKKQYIFSRSGDKLLLNKAETSQLDLAFAYALQHKGIEKLNKVVCEGKIVEIDGRKYKLTAV